MQKKSLRQSTLAKSSKQTISRNMGYILARIGLGQPSIGHQRFSRSIMINWYKRHGFKIVEAFHEGTANHKSTGEQVQDVACVSIKQERVIVSTEMEKSFSRKLIAKIEENLLLKFKHREGFLLNYQKMQWRRYALEKKQMTMIETSYFAVLNADFADHLFLKKA